MNGAPKYLHWCFWLCFTWPFMFVYIAEGGLEKFADIVAKPLWPYILLIYIFSYFAISVIFLHVALVGLGPKLFQARYLSVAIRSVDYVWYFFGGILLSYFATIGFQIHFFQEKEKDWHFVASIYNPESLFVSLYPSCKLVIEKADSPGFESPELLKVKQFCVDSVGPKAPAGNFYEACKELREVFNVLPTELLESLKITRTAKGKAHNDFLFLCENLDFYLKKTSFISEEASDLGALKNEAKPPLWLYFLLAALVALKFVKVSSDVLAQFGKGPFVLSSKKANN